MIPLQRALRRGWPILIVLATAWLYFWRVGEVYPKWVLKEPDGYNGIYAQALLHGHLYLKEAPEMAKLEDPYDPAQYSPYYTFDLSYYKGRIYSYFGVAPVLFLYVPWTALTGTYLSEQFGAGFFMVLGLAVSVALLVALRRRYLPKAPEWALFIAVLVLAIGNLSLLLFWPPYYAQVVQGCARWTQISALGALYLALQPERRTGLWLAVASFFTGMSVVARPVCLPAIFLLLPPCWVLLRRKVAGADQPRRVVLGLLLPAALPITAVGLGLMWFNYARFDWPLEFGTTYQQFGHDLRDMVLFSPAFLPGHIFADLFNLATFTRYFPFMTYQAEPMGMFTMLPFNWMVLLLLAGWRSLAAERSEFGALALAAVIAPVGNMLMLSCYYLAWVRHQMDIILPLSFAAAVGLVAGAHAWHAHPWRRRGLLAVAALLAVVNIWTTVCFAATFPGLPEHPRLAALFNQPVYWWEHLRGEHFTNTLRLDTILPTGRTGSTEPLVYTGTQESADYIYLRYTDESHAVVGYSHSELGSIESESFAIGADRHHVIEITMGSLAPNPGHPVFAGWTPPAIERTRHRVSVKVDGRTMLEQDTQFHPAMLGKVWIGEAPETLHLGRFTGGLRKSEPLPLAAPAPLLPSWPGDGFAFDVQFVNRRVGRSDPLVGSGRRAAGDLLCVTYVDDLRVQFSIDHWQLGRVTGATVAVPSGPQVHHVEVHARATPAPGGSLAVLLDGQPVLELPKNTLFPAGPETVVWGIQSFPSGTEPIFGGRISNVRLLADPLMAK